MKGLGPTWDIVRYILSKSTLLHNMKNLKAKIRRVRTCSTFPQSNFLFNNWKNVFFLASENDTYLAFEVFHFRFRLLRMGLKFNWCKPGTWSKAEYAYLAWVGNSFSNCNKRLEFCATKAVVALKSGKVC